MSHIPGHMTSLELRSDGQSWGCGSRHMLPGLVAPGQVHKSGDRLGNQSGDGGQEIVRRWKNDRGMLHIPSPHSPPFKPPLALPQVTANIKCIVLFIGRCHKSMPLQLVSASAMHIKLDIVSLALAWVCTLLDLGLSSFGFICSFFICLFIPLFILDSLFVLLAFHLMPLPLDTDPCCSF